MSELLFESPYTIGVVGIAVAGVAAFVWLQTAQKAAAWVAISAAAITLILVMLSIQVKTDREKIASLIAEVCATVQRNDRERAYQYIHPNADEGLARAKSEFPRLTFSEARVTRMKSIEVNHLTSPATAIAEFNVFLRVEVDGTEFKVPRFIRAYFMQKDDEWLVTDYEHFEPTAGFRNTPLTGN